MVAIWTDKEIAMAEVDRIIRSKELQAVTGLSRVTIWRREREGNFPRRVKLSAGAVGHRLSEVKEWLANLEAA